MCKHGDVFSFACTLKHDVFIRKGARLFCDKIRYETRNHNAECSSIHAVHKMHKAKIEDVFTEAFYKKKRKKASFKRVIQL